MTFAHHPVIDQQDDCGHYTVNCGYYGSFADDADRYGSWVVDTRSSNIAVAQRVVAIADVITKAIATDRGGVPTRVAVTWHRNGTVTLRNYDFDTIIGTYVTGE